MSTLKGLNPAGRSLVTEDFRKGDPATVEAGPYAENLDLGREISLAQLRTVVTEAMKRFEPEYERWKSDRTASLDVLAANPPTDADAIREWIAEKIDETTMMDELPRGPDEAVVAEADIAMVRKFLDDLAGRIQLAEVVKADRRPPAAAE